MPPIFSKIQNTQNLMKICIHDLQVYKYPSWKKIILNYILRRLQQHPKLSLSTLKNTKRKLLLWFGWTLGTTNPFHGESVSRLSIDVRKHFVAPSVFFTIICFLLLFNRPIIPCVIVIAQEVTR